MKLSILSAEGD